MEPASPSKSHEMMAAEIALRSEEVVREGGFMLFRSPTNASTADFFLIAIDPPSSFPRKMAIIAYKCKEYSFSSANPNVSAEVDNPSATLNAIKNHSVFAHLKVFSQFTFVYAVPLECPSRVMKGMHMVQMNVEMACRGTQSTFANLFIFPKEDTTKTTSHEL